MIRCLIIEDDPVTVHLLSTLIEADGNTCVVSNSPKEATEHYVSGSFDCALCPYDLGKESGIDVVRAIKAWDPALSVIIVTSVQDRDVIKQSFREGAIDFLSKPVSAPALHAAIEAAEAKTKQQRNYIETEVSLRRARETNAIFSNLVPKEISKYTKVAFLPYHEVGGDFFKIVPLENDIFAFVIGDVSGHDLRSALIAAYFQGLLHGTTEKDKCIMKTLEALNDLLYAEWERNNRDAFNSVMSSVSVNVLTLDLSQRLMSISAAGFPPPMWIDSDGSITKPTLNSPPVGWQVPLEMANCKADIAHTSAIFTATDGLDDIAQNLDIDACAVTSHLFLKDRIGKDIMRDDLLCLQIVLDDVSPMPLIHQRYSGAQHGEVDVLQKFWRRSLEFALDVRSEALDNALLCCREAVLNAIKHGCKCEANAVVTLDVSYYPSTRTVRMRVSDPGPGFSYDVHAQRTEVIDKGHLNKSFDDHLSFGLIIIDSLAAHYHFERNGATIVVDCQC